MAPAPKVEILVATKKGAFMLRGDAERETFRVVGPHFLGCMVHHVVADPRNRKTMLASVRTGHLGPTVFRSTDRGKTWAEAKRPPAFRKAKKGQPKRAVHHVFWLRAGHIDEPGVWYAGTSPQGLFRSDDDGVTWAGVDGFNQHPMWQKWTGGDKDGTPDGPKLHSLQVDPRDPQHLYIAGSSGGVFESTDGGADWQPLNKGCAADFLPQKDLEFGHDPHCLVQHPADPDVLYQQNHCGIYRMDRHRHSAKGHRWKRIGNAMPKEVGDIGFPMAVHPRKVDTAWVFPMDGTKVWPRTCPDGRPAVFATHDGGKKWQRHARGLPSRQAWLTVFRQAMAVDHHDPVGVYFGTTTGEIFGSRNEGRSWRSLAAHLPHIYAIEVAGYQQ